MLLTSTSQIIYGEVIFILVGIISAGIVCKVIAEGIEAQANNVPLTEYLKKARKLIIVGIISVVVTTLIPIISNYYL